MRGNSKYLQCNSKAIAAILPCHTLVQPVCPQSRATKLLHCQAVLQQLIQAQCGFIVIKLFSVSHIMHGVVEISQRSVL